MAVLDNHKSSIKNLSGIRSLNRKPQQLQSERNHLAFISVNYNRRSSCHCQECGLQSQKEVKNLNFVGFIAQNLNDQIEKKKGIHKKLKNLLVKQTELVKTVNYWYKKANHKKDDEIDQALLSQEARTKEQTSTFKRGSYWYLKQVQQKKNDTLREMKTEKHLNLIFIKSPKSIAQNTKQNCSIDIVNNSSSSRILPKIEMYTNKIKSPSRKVQQYILNKPLPKKQKLLTKTTVSESMIKQATNHLSLRINTEETLQQVYVKKNIGFLSKRKIDQQALSSSQTKHYMIKRIFLATKQNS